jgi:hypothetical protein
MCANESDEHILRGELDDHYHPIVVPFDIEHISLIAYTIYRIESLSNVGKVLPSSLFCLFDPIEQGCFGLWILRVIVFDKCLGNDSHYDSSFTVCRKNTHFFHSSLFP